jgi:hypothetical protein
MYLAAPLDAQARTKVQTGLLPGLSPHSADPLHGDAVEVFARADRRPGSSGHPLHDRVQGLCEMGRCWVPVAGIGGEWTASGGRKTPRHQRAPWRRDQDRGQKRGDGIGYSGHKQQTGEKVIAIIDQHGSVLAPVPVAPVHETAMVLLPQGLQALKQVAQHVGLDLRGASLSLDGGCDSAPNRKGMFHAGLIPNIPENPRNRKHPKRGRKRLCNTAIHALRMRVE